MHAFSWWVKQRMTQPEVDRLVSHDASAKPRRSECSRVCHSRLSPYSLATVQFRQEPQQMHALSDLIRICILAPLKKRRRPVLRNSSDGEGLASL